MYFIAFFMSLTFIAQAGQGEEIQELSPKSDTVQSQVKEEIEEGELYVGEDLFFNGIFPNLDMGSLKSFANTSEGNLRLVSNYLAKSVADVRLVREGFVFKDSHKDIKAVRVPGGQKGLKGFEHLSFDDVKDINKVQKAIYAHLFSDLHIRKDQKKAVMEYLFDKTGTVKEPIMGLEFYKKRLAEVDQSRIYTLKDERDIDHSKKCYIVVKHNELKNKKLDAILDKNPNHVVVIDFTEDAGRFLDNDGTLKMSSNDLSLKIKHIILVANEKVTHIGNNFLYGSQALTSISFKGLEKVTDIGNNFLSNSKALKNIYVSDEDQLGKWQELLKRDHQYPKFSKMLSIR